MEEESLQWQERRTDPSLMENSQHRTGLSCEITGFEPHLLDANLSFSDLSCFGPTAQSAATAHPISRQPNLSISTASRLPEYAAIPFIRTTPADFSELQYGDITQAIESYDDSLMRNDCHSETAHLFLNECDFHNRQQKPRNMVLPPTNLDSISSQKCHGDWDTHRAEITQMYSEEQKTLKEIMEFMEKEHKFKASEKQYKAKLKDWKITKYIPNPMAKWMAMKAEERKRLGKHATTFQFKNQILTEDRVKRLVRDTKTDSHIATNCSTPDEVKYFTPVTAPKQTPKTLSSQAQQTSLDGFEDFTQEDPFAMAIFTALGENETGREDGATGLICERKIYEVHYNSRGQQFTVLVKPDGSWNIAKCQDLDQDSALIWTKFYTREHDIERSELLIQSPFLVSALQEVITEYPGVNIQSKAIVIRGLPECIFHYRTELQTYGAGLVDMAPRKHLGLLLQHCFNALKLHLDRFYSSMVFSNSPGLNFDDLWMAFRPGELLCQDTDGRMNASRLVTMRRSNLSTWHLETLRMSFDGTNFGYEQTSCEVQQYDGYMGLDQLPIFPLKYHTDENNLRLKLEQRGRRYVISFGADFRQYVGMAKSITRHGIDSSGSGKVKAPWGDIHVNGRIMIDFEAFNRNNPTCRAAFSHVIASANEAQHRLSSEDYIICNDLLPGFALEIKHWCFFNIDLVTEVNFNTAAFDNLVLESSQKEMISALVMSHNQSRNELSGFKDIIRGKGKGLMLLLHGQPGTGKTLTAGNISEHARMPLYSITAGDLGTDSSSVEKNLAKAFSLATSWKTILLIDEADIFLERRSTNDLQRNALVSIFLRMLEYYEGIMFLTTNRAGNIDRAFLSRINVMIHFNPPDQDSRAQIWKLFISKALGEQPPWLDETALQKLATKNLNGREIRNVVVIAGRLAESHGCKLSVHEIERALEERRMMGIHLNGRHKGNVRSEPHRGRTEETPRPKRRRLEFSATEEESADE
ncbi:P-loop containing nucleoside triphosphate hydrolase [Glarea lozoyensis ATCC 20868]|uniref:p-loop containing nucleoside triphosphate hydrolase n=1 Tax=Glarea lozoyensis (strain ATCC 20868 / MF5171) TaxID=1116229 RepID=S3E288_GLAL2|nr:P-loop containing nucleoside triphosphate hydrolase [Glarea lozoyensis ATCC 20868]EPE32588.1 P-loop containing nucleoside triphosphate hydrolase [Glarea lozoyensis ATCC 20868]